MLLYFEQMRSAGRLFVVMREGNIFGILCRRRRHALFTKISGSFCVVDGETNVLERYGNAQTSW
jgi:hypothetical protein